MTMLATRPTKEGRWTADPGFGIYVHVPFCAHRCHYCDFNTYEGLDELHGRYVDALVSDIRRADPSPRAVTSIFFGGGTPTLLPARQLGRVLDAVRGRLALAADAEVTVEANPETVDEAYFDALLHAGVDRVSIGVQSLVPHVLRGLGRTHPAERALAAVAAAQRAGFTDVNVDLIYGSPWESETDWRDTLERALAAEPTHVSAYALTVESGTPLHTFVATGRVPDVDPDIQAERHGIAAALLAEAGYARYEISNWAQPGRACAHNVLYWCAGDYLAFGAGAHGHMDGHRYWHVRLPREYIAAVEARASTIAGDELLDRDARAGEALALGLRLTTGIDVESFRARFGEDPVDRRGLAIARLMDLGLLVRDGGHLRITERGTMLASEVQGQVL
ncbi:MAG: radical SAM family heme chaperone HemW [Actinomycetota bacterium]|nr:radical SAM family heme chaperone HemW [Actinomycetota bacterium]